MPAPQSSRPDAPPSGLVTATQTAVRHLVRDALAVGPGGTLPTNATYTRDHGLGAGTIQRAIALLADRGALTLTSRGHLGRLVASLDVGQAWQAAGLPPVRLVLPPSGAHEIDRIEDALTEQLTDLGIPQTVRHLRGGSQRLRLVEEGAYDMALVSAGALEDQRTHGGASGPSRSLAPGTYYGPGRLVVVRRHDDPARTGPLRVAIDRGSWDHRVLTHAEFPSGVDYVESAFPEVPAAVLRHEVDAGIWHITASPVPLDLAGLTTTPLVRPEALEAWRRLSRAALVASAARPELGAILDALPLFDPDGQV